MTESLDQWFQHAWERWSEQNPDRVADILRHEGSTETIRRVWQCSEFVHTQCQRHPELLSELLSGGFESLEPDEDGLKAQMQVVTDESGLMALLRQHRNRWMAAIAWYDFLGRPVDETLQALSRLADVCVQQALDWVYRDACGRYGTPRNEEGQAQHLIILGMGKLGACELNFSSDIDLIFCYPEAGETDGTRVISNDEFFLRVCRQLVKVLDQRTADGFVFRTDTRLRPHGESGPLAMNFVAMEAYYVSQAREWERYAMIKARPLTGDPDEQAQLMQMLCAFVYRRYLDYGVFESIRKMKQQIERELRRKDRLDNIKLGPGGIREIEFIGQAFQLIRGGRDRSLQHRGIVRILQLLGEKDHIDANTASELTADYYFLRRLENYLQAMADQQTHDLPTQNLPRQRLALAMQCADWSLLEHQTAEVMTRVHGHFETLVVIPEYESPDARTELDWHHASEAELQHYLEQLGFSEGERLAKSIRYFFQSYSVRSLQSKGNAYLERLMPALTRELVRTSQAEQSLALFLDMLEHVVTRVSYLVLLVENQGVLQQLIQLATASPWILSQITRSPILLDELIDPRSLYAQKNRTELENELSSLMANVDESDLERQMEELRLFKKANVLRVAASDITGSVPLMIVSDALTEIAEVILVNALDLAWRDMAGRYGVPAGASRDQVSGFSIVAFGKLGGIELGFGSDLDVVFLHRNVPMEEHTNGEKPILSSLFYARLAKRLIHLLTAQTFSGALYEIDLRLRPNGNSGLLVSSLDSFEKYQLDSAWTWEHQSLVRARPVAGDEQIGDSFRQIRERVLCRSRDIDSLMKDVKSMRGKMRDNLLDSSNAGFDLKQSPGGIVDIEFIVQFGILMLADQTHDLVRYTDNIRLIEGLNRVGYLDEEAAQGLISAYKAFRQETHRASLAERPGVVDPTILRQHITTVESVWSSKFGPS